MSDTTGQPEPTTDTPASTGRFRMRWWMWLALVATLLLLGWLAWNLAMAARIDAELQAIRDAGYPATPEELNDWYPEPEGENAADLYLEAFNHLRDPDPADEPLLPLVGARDEPLDPTQPIPEDVRAAMQRWLDANQHSLRLLDEAADIPQTRYPVDLSEGLDTLLPHINQVRTATHLLVTEARLQLADSRIDEAIRTYNQTAGVANSLRDEPVLVSMLVYDAVLATLFNETERMLQAHNPGADQLEQIITMVTRCWNPRALERATATERALSYQFTSDYLAVKWRTDTKLFLRAYIATGLNRRDVLLALDIMNDFVAAAASPPAKQVALFEDAGKRADNIPEMYPIAKEVLPVLDRVSVIHHRTYFQRNTTLVALALLRYRTANNGFPDDLADLVPDYLDAVPVDTFTGRPIEYMQPTADSFILFTPEDRGPIPATDPKRLEFIRDLEDYHKFEYRVPEAHPTQPAPDDEDGPPPLTLVRRVPIFALRKPSDLTARVTGRSHEYTTARLPIKHRHHHRCQPVPHALVDVAGAGRHAAVARVAGVEPGHGRPHRRGTAGHPRRRLPRDA